VKKNYIFGQLIMTLFWVLCCDVCYNFFLITMFGSSLPRGGTTLCTWHAHSKYIIDNRMFTIQFKNGRWSENISLKKLLKLNVNLSKNYIFGQLIMTLNKNTNSLKLHNKTEKTIIIIQFNFFWGKNNNTCTLFLYKYCDHKV
jgi:hypothetical protein